MACSGIRRRAQHITRAAQYHSLLFEGRRPPQPGWDGVLFEEVTGLGDCALLCTHLGLAVARAVQTNLQEEEKYQILLFHGNPLVATQRGNSSPMPLVQGRSELTTDQINLRETC